MNAWTAEIPPIFLCSSKTKHGRMEILTHIAQILAKNSRT